MNRGDGQCIFLFLFFGTFEVRIITGTLHLIGDTGGKISTLMTPSLYVKLFTELDSCLVPSDGPEH